MSGRGAVLVTCKQMQVELPRHLPRLEQAGYRVHAPELVGQQFSSQEMLAMMEGVVGVIAGDDQLDRRFFDGSDALKILVRWGIGMDSVDHGAARDHGVVVRNTPGVFGHEVADAAMAYLLALARGTVQVDRAVRSGGWRKFEGTTLHGQRVGIVGAGAIGREIQRRAAAFGCDTAFADPFARQEDLAAPLTPTEELFATSRFVVLACPLTEQTHHMVDESLLSSMRADAVLVNVARGPVVHEPALIATLQRGGIAGAALDVFEVEPLPEDSALRSFDNVILGAHNGSNTRQGVENASARAVDILLEELAG